MSPRGAGRRKTIAAAASTRIPTLETNDPSPPLAEDAAKPLRSTAGMASATSQYSAGWQAAEHWFAGRQWQVFDFQREVWSAYLNGDSGLLHATTGSGKTYAVWFGPVIEALQEAAHQQTTLRPTPDLLPSATTTAVVRRSRSRGSSSSSSTTGPLAPPLRVLWVTPLRALAADTAQSLLKPLADLGLPWRVETRTGDTDETTRRRQQTAWPTVLITTPESLQLMLCRSDAQQRFAQLRLVVCDEWHELLASKRGVQAELGLARLRRWHPALRIWGLSATLGNLEIARQVLLGQPHDAIPRGQLICGHIEKPLQISTLIPSQIERFPWGGHLGLKQAPAVVEALDAARSALVFTNTRFLAEQWYQTLLQRRPDWAGQLALHHGSLDGDTRHWVEQALREGRLRCVVCTSSLDLGVDFTPVDLVLQVGSPKGVARLLQRAGRSGHDPGRTSKLVCVPTNAWELVEFAALQDAIASRAIESREPLTGPLDVLAQHAVTIAVGSGFRRDDLFDEVRQTYSYAQLDRTDWDWILEFLTTGGTALRAYPEYRRTVVADDEYVIADARQARQHRMSIGTIVSDQAIQVRYLSGGRIGSIEESFISRLKPGDLFRFAGKALELVRVHDLTAYVRKSDRNQGQIPRWNGGRMPLSSELASAILARLERARQGQFDGPEMDAARPMLELQARWSKIPGDGELLIERLKTREGHHLFVYPFAGRLVHEGLAALWAYRLARCRPLSLTMSANDYGMELLSPTEAPWDEAMERGLFSTARLADDLLASLNSVEMAKRQFREVARVAGLIFDGYPGQRKTARQLQASASLLFDVFAEYDAGNRFLRQARQEVLARQLEYRRLADTLERLQQSRRTVTHPGRPTPLAFPLMIDRLRERLSSEQLADRIARMQQQLEKAANTSSCRTKSG
jgi:ATP-dependent helicase Lhr and Lhr-like helicase